MSREMDHAVTTVAPNFRQILGLNFFSGSASEAVDLMQKGGLLVVPSAPTLKDLPHNPEYREALLEADLLITDSALMVLLWNFVQHDSLRRLSGLEYLRELLLRPDFRQPGQTFWIMARPSSAAKNIAWLRSRGMEVNAGSYYLAPLYGAVMDDPILVRILREKRPRHIVLTIGGGAQERLGLYLRRQLNHAPSIHCIGAAIAFLSGDQVHIPDWADRCYLGWLFRCLSDPQRYGPRYWDARHLMPLLLHYRDRLPDVIQ
jgi:UDP-N-acetyl-D-mannosaminuronic acid transferase (WecB/TagA/CpsF family)